MTQLEPGAAVAAMPFAITYSRKAILHVDRHIPDAAPGAPAVGLGGSQPGSGLGLSLASAVAEAHAGHLVLKDGGGPPDKPGLAATLVLPAA